IQTAESYDPAVGTFGSVTAMIAARGYHTATLLNDGRVLLAGDISFDSRSQRAEPPNILASAEIYTPSNSIAAVALLSQPATGKNKERSNTPARVSSSRRMIRQLRER